MYARNIISLLYNHYLKKKFISKILLEKIKVFIIFIISIPYLFLFMRYNLL